MSTRYVLLDSCSYEPIVNQMFDTFEAAEWFAKLAESDKYRPTVQALSFGR